MLYIMYSKIIYFDEYFFVRNIVELFYSQEAF